MAFGRPRSCACRPEAGYGSCMSVCSYNTKAGCAMSMLLTLLMIYFALVMLWAAPRLFRLLHTRISLLPGAYAAPDCYHATRHDDSLQKH